MTKNKFFRDKSLNFESFCKKYIEYLNQVLQKLDKKKIEELEKILEIARKKKQTIFIAGNGGAAATSITMANDLGFDILKKTKIKKTFKIQSLNDNPSVITAIANDTGYENIFLNQLKIHYNHGDLLIVLSASGNSLNLIKASEWVKKNGGKTIGILGFDGGKLLKKCDLAIHILTEKNEYGPVEDVQLILNHIFAHWFQKKYIK
jgi:D-sedoheptulose 7-phosphate isomerase